MDRPKNDVKFVAYHPFGLKRAEVTKFVDFNGGAF